MTSPEPELHLLPGGQFLLEQPKPRTAAVGSLVFHAVIMAGALIVPWAPPAPVAAPRLAADLSKATPLIAPPRPLTQRETGRGRVSQELNLEGLLPRPLVAPAPPSLTRPAAPKPLEPKLAAATPPSLPEPPPVSTAPAIAAATGPPPGPPIEAPPRIQAEERPKLAFEKPGSIQAPVGARRLPPPPRSTVDEAVQAAARAGGAGGVVVGDLGEGAGGLGAALNQPPSPGQNASRLELLSDPMGADFRPYLIRILAAVRRNWFAVMPESVKLGRRGRVQIQFAISRDGGVPKLVIAVPSGTDALDRAAVAGISASNPFPPLPPEFRGEQVRLQLTFTYNMPVR